MSDVAIITRDGTWAIPAAGFSNPKYLSALKGLNDNDDSTGFEINAGASLIVAFEGTYTGATVAHEQTLDPAGEVGWFEVLGAPTDGGSAVATGSDSGMAYVFSAIGVRHRIKVTALSTGTIECRIRVDSFGLGASASGGGGGGGGSEATASAAALPVVAGTGKPLNIDLFSQLRALIGDANGDPIDWTLPVAMFGTGTAGDPASGTGTDTTGVLTIQGVTGMTAIVVGGADADGAAASGNAVPAGGRYTAAAPTLDDGDRAEFRMNLRGALIVGGATAENAAAPADAASFPVPIGGKYNSTLPTYADGDRVQAQFGSRGSLNVSLFDKDGTQNVGFSGSTTDPATSGTSNRISTNSLIFALGASTLERPRTIAGSFGSPTGVLAVEQAGASFRNITASASTDVKNAAGILHKLVIGTGGAGSTLTLYNDTTGGTSNPIGVFDTATRDSIDLDVGFSNGLQAVTAAGTPANITIVYR